MAPVAIGRHILARLLVATIFAELLTCIPQVAASFLDIVVRASIPSLFKLFLLRLNGPLILAKTGADWIKQASRAAKRNCLARFLPV